MKMDYKIEGIADVNRTLKEIAPREAQNLMRATVQDIASQLAKSAKVGAPKDGGDLKKAIKAKRERTYPGKAESSVLVNTGKGGAFYWRFLEYGQGPDGVEHAFFLRALEEMRPNMDRVYMESFVKKLEARLARERKRLAAG